MRFKKLFLLSWKRFLIIIVAEVVFIVLHNLVSGLLGGEEAVFFILAVFVVPLYLIISVVYTLVLRSRQNKEL